MDLKRIQDALTAQKIDGWLFFDHHHRDPFSYAILGLPKNLHVTRRWYYYIPAKGEPLGLVHQIETRMLDSLPGKKLVYAGWQLQHHRLKDLIRGARTVAMQYSPLCAVPYVATVDAGTVELVRSCGVEVVSAATLIQSFEAQLSPTAIESHLAAGKKIDQIRAAAFDFIRTQHAHKKSPTEYEVKRFILDRYEEEGLTTEYGPDIMANQNASDPHYDPAPTGSAPIKPGDLVVIDMWGKLKEPGSIYYDITWCGFCGSLVPPKIQEVFDVVVGARDAAIEKVISTVSAGAVIRGFEVDDVARAFITERGYGEYFFHRTGHSIGEAVHGNGANIDNLESHDDRPLITNSCFSIEPGIYLADFGIRSEVNILIDSSGARVSGEVQRQMVLI